MKFSLPRRIRNYFSFRRPARQNSAKSEKDNVAQLYGTLSERRNFWDIEGYKTTINRLEDGYELGEKLKRMLTERAEIEENYSKELRKWKEDWESNFAKKPIEYGSALETWQSLLAAGEETAQVHDELCKKIMNSPVKNLNEWLEENYQKHIINFKVKKDFMQKFEEAQLIWKQNIDLLNESKQKYYDLCDSVDDARKLKQNADSNSRLSKEDKQRAEKDLTNLNNQYIEAKEQYESHINALEGLKQAYQQRMKKVFEKAQGFENIRLEKFKEVIEIFNSLLLSHYKSDNFENIIEKSSLILKSVNFEKDLTAWSKKYGYLMEPNWPKFEEYNKREIKLI